MRTDCTDVCECVTDIECLHCKRRKQCLFDDDMPESDYHEQLIECFTHQPNVSTIIDDLEHIQKQIRNYQNEKEILAYATAKLVEYRSAKETPYEE